MNDTYAERGERTQVLVGLDTFRDDGRPDFAREIGHRSSECSSCWIHVDVVNDFLIEFDEFRLEPQDVPERRISRACVVDRDPHTTLTQFVDRVPQGSIVLDRDVLGDFDDEPIAREIRLAESRQQSA